MHDTKSQFEATLEEHRQLRGVTRELRDFLEAPRPQPDTDKAHRWASSLAGRLLKLHDQLYQHFRDEEASGFLDEICEEHPEASRQADVLRADHERLLGELRSVLRSTMVYAENREPERPTLRRSTRSILDDLEEHEHQETELAQRLFTEELGAVD